MGDVVRFKRETRPPERPALWRRLLAAPFLPAAALIAIVLLGYFLFGIRP